jgi:hypothetical protein
MLKNKYYMGAFFPRALTTCFVYHGRVEKRLVYCGDERTTGIRKIKFTQRFIQNNCFPPGMVLTPKKR